MRYTAPDVLKARIRGAVARAATPPVAADTRRKTFRWWREVAAGVAIAIASSAVTFVAARHSEATYAAEGIETACLVPLVSHERAVGVIGLYHTRDREWPDDADTCCGRCQCRHAREGCRSAPHQKATL